MKALHSFCLFKDIPWRGIGVGIIFVIGLSIWAQYTSNVVQGSPVACDFSAVGAVFFLFLFVALLNPLFKALKIPFILNKRDLITVYSNFSAIVQYTLFT